MTIYYLDSFDHYATADATKKGWVIGSGCSISTTGGRRGGGALVTGGSGGFTTTRTLPSAVGTLVAGVAFRPAVTSTSGDIIFNFLDAGTSQVNIVLNGDQTLSVRRNTTVLATSTRPIPFANYSYLELRAVIHPTAGAYELRVNGETWLSATNVNTRNTANSTVSQFQMQYSTFSNNAGYYDDLYLADTFLGDIRVDALLPVADGTYQQFTNAVIGRAARYWRIYISAIDSNNTAYLAEVEMRTSIGGADQCTGGTANASAVTGGAVANAFDNNTSTAWGASSGSIAWISYDFGVAKEIVEVALTAKNNATPGAPTVFSIEYSDDNTNWNRAWDAPVQGVWAPLETRVFTRPTSGHYWAVDEAQVFGIGNDALTGGAVGSKESFVLSDLPITGTILGVQAGNLVAKTDAGTAKAKNLLRSGSTDALGPEMALSTSYLYNLSVHETDPATGSAWSKTAVDGLEVGLQVTG